MKNQKEKKQKNQISQEELLKAIAALEEIVMAQEPEDWEEEEKVTEEKLPTAISSLEEKVKNKIRKKLLKNGGELTRNNLYRAVRGDRMGSATFNRALQSLEASREIAIVKKDTGGRGRPFEKISSLRAIL